MKLSKRECILKMMEVKEKSKVIKNLSKEYAIGIKQDLLSVEDVKRYNNDIFEYIVELSEIHEYLTKAD